MSNPRPLIIALAFGLIAVVLVYVYVQQVRKQATKSEVAMVSVVRATENIPPRTTIKESMIEQIEVPADLAPPDAVIESDEILGKVSLTAIYQQQILMNQMFQEETALKDISRMLKEGELAVTIGVTEVSGLGGNLKPGDKVDVLATITSNEEVGVASTFAILRDISVMAVGQDIGFSGETGDPAAATTPPISKSVTLKVNPKDAEILSLASEVGSIRLALRYPDDLYAPKDTGTALTEFTKYTPTRKDLQEAAKQALAEADALRQQAAYNAQAQAPRYSAPAPVTPEVNPGQGIEQLANLGPPPVFVELIMGGQVSKVELQK
jgi:pilus assembly protein CpaB